jgi:hypothetical protein
MVFTGAYATFQWNKEATFNTAAACIGTSGLPFGFEQKITSWTFTNNAIPLQRLNDVRLNTFAYGQTQGNISLDYVLASPWFLDVAGFSTGCTTGCADPFTHTWTIGSCAASKVIPSMTVEVGTEQGATDTVRTLTGAIVNSISISTSIGEVVRVSQDMTYANETVTTALDTTPGLESLCNYIPYTFAHGALYDGAVSACNLLAEVQCLDLTINQNGEHLWGLGNSVAASAYRRVFEVTGRFKVSYIDTSRLVEIYQQSKDTLANTCPAQTLTLEQPTLNIVFTNGIGTVAAPIAGSRILNITFTGISIKDFSTPIEPNEPIFEEINFQAREATATAINGISAIPAAS